MSKRSIAAELKRILEKIPQEKREVAARYADELIFMQETLKDLKERIRKEGTIEHFVQGSQNFTRESPALKGYNNTLKQYNSTFKQLCDLLPKEEATKQPAFNPLYDFVEDRGA